MFVNLYTCLKHPAGFRWTPNLVFSNPPSLSMTLFTCPICTESTTDDLVLTKCGHLFHNICVSQWLNSNKICPSCRARSVVKDLRQVYMNSSEDSFRMSQISSPQKDYSAAFKKCSALNNSLKTKCESLEETLSDLQKSYTAKQEEVEKEIQKRADLERKHTNTRQHVSNLQAKLTYQAGDAQMCKDLKAKVSSRSIMSRYSFNISPNSNFS